MKLFFLLLICTCINSCSVMSASPKFTPAAGFNLDRYLGTWYEIARLPNQFEKDLVRVTAAYSLRSDGLVKVLNQGFREDKRSVAEGKAKFAGSSDIAHLKVSFFWIFYSDYIVIDLDSEYQYALVSGNSHKYLWILSRQPTLDPEIREKLLLRAEKLGFDTNKLFWVPQDTTGSN